MGFSIGEKEFKYPQVTRICLANFPSGPQKPAPSDFRPSSQYAYQTVHLVKRLPYVRIPCKASCHATRTFRANPALMQAHQAPRDREEAASELL